MPQRDVTGLGLAFGTEEEGRAWVGRASAPRRAEAPVSEAMIHNYCALVQDGNPRYWREGVSPPGLMVAYSFAAPWRPGGARTDSLIALEVPLPGHHVINVSTDTELVEDATVGDCIEIVDEVIDVSPLKRTRLGVGHFVTTRTTYARQGGATLAVNTNVIFRYDVPEAAA